MAIARRMATPASTIAPFDRHVKDNFLYWLQGVRSCCFFPSVSWGIKYIYIYSNYRYESSKTYLVQRYIDPWRQRLHAQAWLRPPALAERAGISSPNAFGSRAEPFGVAAFLLMKQQQLQPPTFNIGT